MLYINTKHYEMTSLLEETMRECACADALFRVGGNHTGHMEWHKKPGGILCNANKQKPLTTTIPLLYRVSARVLVQQSFAL